MNKSPLLKKCPFLIGNDICILSYKTMCANLYKIYDKYARIGHVLLSTYGHAMLQFYGKIVKKGDFIAYNLQSFMEMIRKKFFLRDPVQS